MSLINKQRQTAPLVSVQTEKRITQRAPPSPARKLHYENCFIMTWSGAGEQMQFMLRLGDPFNL